MKNIQEFADEAMKAVTTNPVAKYADAPPLLLQKDLFAEDELQDTQAVIEKYFKVSVIPDEDIYSPNFLKNASVIFRGSLAMAARLGHKFEYANALNWLPHFSESAVSRRYRFLDLKNILSTCFTSNEKWFVRPVSCFKEFSGNVYNYQKLMEERNFLVNNKNIADTIICVMAPPVDIGREWRAVFVNHKLVSICQYMKNGKIELAPESEVPEKAIEYAKEIGADSYFQNKFNYIIDVGEFFTDGYNYKMCLGLLEVNAFETSSFYACDLDKIYSEYAKL